MQTSHRCQCLSVRPRVTSLLIAACLLPPSIGSAATGDIEAPFSLFKDGAPLAAIVVNAQALTPPPDRLAFGYLPVPDDVPSDLARALAEFQRDLRVGYGVELPLLIVDAAGNAVPAPDAPLPETLNIQPDTTLPNRIEIVVEDRSMMDEDHTSIDFPAATVMRITGGESGIMRTLFQLLEDYGGARYLFQAERQDIGIGAHFPERTSLSVPRVPVVHERCFFPLCRDSGRTVYGSNWAGEANRRYHWHWEMRVGAKHRLTYGHHLPHVAFPLEAYASGEAAYNPVIFPILRGGRLLPWEHGLDRAHWQPCYSHPETAAEAVRNLLAHLQAYPHVRSLSLAINDNGGFCECDTCLEADGGGRRLNAVSRYHRSESYYAWVNHVVEQVTAVFPEVMFGVTAYREALAPPSFALHPNVVVVMCFDFHAMLDPAVRETREQLVRDWREIARIKAYSYNYGVLFYSLPRFYFPEMQHMLQFFHEQGAIGAHDESYYTTVAEGPKNYVFHKLLEDPYRDLEAIMVEWCEAAVGAQAAPALRAYYAFWEDYWRTQAIRTHWWNSRHATYLSLGQFGSYLYGLASGDMERCRAEMERMLALAERHGTPEQQQRARLLFRIFEWNEANAVASAAALMAPDGTLPDRKAALALLARLPEAQRACEIAHHIPHETQGTDGSWFAPASSAGRSVSLMPLLSALAAVGTHAEDPDVLAALRAAADDQTLEANIRMVARAMVHSFDADSQEANLLGDGIFETDAHGWSTLGRTAPPKRVDTVALRGRYALQTIFDRGRLTLEKIIPEAKPDTAYFFSAQVYVPAEQPVAEGRLNIRGSPTVRQGDQFNNLAHTRNIPDIVLTPGQWNFISCVIPRANRTDSLRLRILLQSFEQGDRFFFDNVQLLEMGGDA